MGPNFAMNITWERLILLSLSKKRPKKYALFKPGHLNAGIMFLLRRECNIALRILQATFLRHPGAWRKLGTVINDFAEQSYLNFLSFFKINNYVLAAT